MRHVTQHPSLPLCGHACLAMVLGLKLDEAIDKMGHKRTTRTRELVAALGKRAKDRRLIPVRQRAIPEFAVMKVTWKGRPQRGHFAIHQHGYVHDPLLPGKMTRHDWDLWVGDRGRVTSALELQ